MKSRYFFFSFIALLLVVAYSGNPICRNGVVEPVADRRGVLSRRK